MFYTIYETTNLVNGKTYIGKHQTTDPNDSYLGSGSAFLSAKKKYGTEWFEKTVLFVFDNENDMHNKEAELVTEDFIKLDSNYNLIPGGINFKCPATTKAKISLGNKNKRVGHRWLTNGEIEVSTNDQEEINSLLLKGWIFGMSSSTKSKLSKSMKNVVKTPEHKANLGASSKGREPWNKGKKLPKFSEEHKKKISDSVKKTLNRE